MFHFKFILDSNDFKSYISKSVVFKFYIVNINLLNTLNFKSVECFQFILCFKLIIFISIMFIEYLPYLHISFILSSSIDSSINIRNCVIKKSVILEIKNCWTSIVTESNFK